MKVKKILLGLLSLICFGFFTFVITSCGVTSLDSESVSDSIVDSSSIDSSDSTISGEETPHVHEWIVDEVLVEATCIVDGVTLYKCINCNDTKHEIIQTTGHTEVIDAAVAATCTETGLTEGSHCEVCKEILVAQEEIDMLDHIYVEQVVIEATCISNGVALFTCLNCNDTKHEIIQTTGHTEVIDVSKIPTCTETGLTEGSHCDVCKEVLVAQEEIAALGHENSYICGKCEQINEFYYTEGLKFTLLEYRNGYSVSRGQISVETKKVVIPSTYNGLPVTSIGDYAFYECSSLTSVTIGNNVTKIGERAFEGCSSLTNITIPDSVTSIGDYAFYECSSLTSITIGNSVTNIGTEAFSYCFRLKRVYYTGTIVSWCNIMLESRYSSPLSLEASLYMLGGNNEWYLVTSIEIPDSVTNIGTYAFSGCSSLTSVTIGNSIKRIDSSAFNDCDSLTSITMPISVIRYIPKEILKTVVITNGDSIPNNAFEGCSSLISITIPDSVKSIGDYAFRDCSSLTSVTLGNNVTNIGKRAFEDCSSLKSIIIPDSVTSIGYRAFSCCSSLKSIIIPDSVTSIGDYAFNDCGSLTSITIGKGVKSIGDYAFNDCGSLTSIIIPDSVISIGTGALTGCSSLTSITIGKGVKSIGYSAFDGCSSLKDVYYAGTTTQWINITISLDTTSLINATIHYNYEG